MNDDDSLLTPSLEKVLVDTLTKQKVEFEIARDNGHDTLTLYFPEITIKRTDNSGEYKIYDVFFVYTFGYKIRYTVIRTTFTKQEIMLGFLHPHVNNDYLVLVDEGADFDEMEEYEVDEYANRSTDLCLGNSPLKLLETNYSSLTKIEDRRKLIEDNIYMLAVHAKTFLETENVGDTYVSTNSLEERSRGSRYVPARYSYFDKVEMKSFFSRYPDLWEKFKKEIKVKNKKVRIPMMFEVDLPVNTNRDFFSFYDNGNWYRYQQVEINENQIDFFYDNFLGMKFKDKIYSLSIIKPKSKTDKSKIYFSPKLIASLEIYLNNMLLIQSIL